MAKRGKGVFSNSDVKDRFLQAIRLGLSNEKACDYAGISEPTLYSWINRGEEDEINGKTDTEQFKFFKDYKKAKSDFVMRHVARITQASDDGSWQASAWLLERRAPDEYGQKSNLNVEAKEKVEIVNDIPNLNNE